MTNVIRGNEDEFNNWISFEVEGENSNPSLEASVYTPDNSDEDILCVTVWGREYKNVDNYTCQDSLYLDLSMDDVRALREFLNSVLKDDNVE